VPELPEVETIANGVHARARGQQVLSVWFSRYPQPFLTRPARMARALTGLSIQQVRRIGKHIVVDLGAGKNPSSPSIQWIVHLGMTGRLLYCEATAPVATHTHARLELDSGHELRFVDARRFGRLDLIDLSCEPSFSGPGTEPLTIDSVAFAALFHGRRTPIKSALLNQSLLHGVGNIYADESLFHAGIRPLRHASSLTRAELERLRLSLQKVLRAAIALGGSSVSDYVDANGIRGFFQLEHCVYLRTGKPCRLCGSPIQRILVAARGTHYCNKCQK
jgi:formamidopyrimidine-DNA glycosylase